MKKRFWKIFGIVTACLIVAAVLGTVIYVENFTHSEEFVRFDKNKLNEVYTAVTLLDDEGKTMNESLSLNNCKQIPLSALHDYTYMAFVAVEDKRFFEHKGIDFRRVGGALLHNLQSGGYKEGASTISQQLIKNTHLDNSKSIKRKLNEMMLAKQLERTYGKKEILEMYVNTIYFGRNAYGIETAANVYFNKSATDLTVSESAVLAGMIKAPNVYAPDKNAEKCRARRNTVLKLMSEQGLIDAETYRNALAEQIYYRPQTVRNERGYVCLAMREACKILNMTPVQLAKSDFIIETYCNQRQQKQLCDIIDEDDTLNKNGTPADVAAVLLNNSGGIKACMLRGDGAGTKRQVGSALKPIAVYAPALNERLITQASPILDEETDFNGYKPANAGGYNGWTTVKYAVAKSLNVPAVKTLNALTLPTAEKYLDKLGIRGEQNLSLALGNADGGLNVFDLAKCYATLANDGQTNEVGFVKNIYSSNGLIYSREQKNERVFRSGANYLMTDMLVNTVDCGTAKLLKNGKFQVAAKTGTVGNSNGNSDALVAGYTTENTFVLWYSGDLPNEVNGSTAPCKLGNKLLSKLYANKVPSSFEPPQTVVRVGIDKNDLYDNQLVTKSDDGEVFWFDKANLPKENANKPHYDYRLDVKTEDDEIFITLPQTKGDWRIYKVQNNETQLISTQCTYRGKNTGKATFYAELYVDGRLEYTTPKIAVTAACDDEKETPQHSEREFPDLTDFWYWG